MRNILRQILLTPRGGLTSLLTVAVLFSGGYYVKTSGMLMPGELSAAHPKNEPLNGYVSHADFENECTHCHAPLHCITDTRCQDCHIEIARQRATASSLHSLLPGTQRCQTCHIEHQGRQAVITELAYLNLDHEKISGFSLAQHTVDYQDQPMNCASCHSQARYASETLDCLTCHVEADQATLATHLEQYGESCVPCHDGSDRMADFNHDNFYVLEGAHFDTDCTDCHQQKVFAGTASDCAGCHAEPELHAGIFGLECARCHSAQAWAPAQLTQHEFVLEHGGDPITNCETCHAGTYTEYPCYTCHTDEEMREVHAAEGIRDYLDCVACHPTGRGGETAEQANARLLAIQNPG